MPASRRTRRKLERQRARRPTRSTRMSLQSRLLLIGGGLAAAAIGIGLLLVETTGNAARLGRVAGILILVGTIAAGFGAYGRM